MKHVTSYIFLIIAFLLLGVNGVAAQEEDCPFKVTDRSNVNISYNKEDKVLSIEGSGNVTIEGDGTSTGWGIEIESQSIHFQVTIKDLSIEREGVPLKIKGVFNCSITIEGTNRFVSTGSSGTAGIEVKGPLSLRGSGSLTAIGAKGTGDTPGGAGISGGGGYLTIDGGIIRAEGGAGAPGIGVSDPQEGMTIQIFGGTVTAIGSGGKNPAPGIYGGTSSNSTTIAGNAFVIAIDGTDDDEVIATTTQIENHTKGLFIRGEQESDGSIVWASSDLKGDITLESNAEIPKGATVTIAAGQTFTIAPGVTLTNNGTLENNGALTNEGTFTNNGTLSGTGTVESNTSLNIGGKDGFDVSNTGGGVTFSYNGKEKLLTISGTIGDVLIKGRNKDNAVGCGIVIAQYASFYLTIEDLNIVTDEALVFRGTSDGHLANYNLTLQGTNRLTSTSGGGINLNGNNITFAGSGSLTVTGGNGCAGIQGLESLSIYNNAFVVVIGGKDAASGISGNLHHDSGFLIYGSQDDTGNFSQEYSKLVGRDFTLGGDAEIPKGAEVIIAEGQTFIIDAGVTLTNSGTIENEGTIDNEGIIYNKGTLTGNPVGGKLYHYITFDANYPASPAVDERYILQGETLPSDIFTRSRYTFQGWYDAPSGETKVETSAEPQTLYARWEAVPVPEPEPTVYYTVTLPFVEGAVTDPVAGDYDVESGSTFRFYLTLDTAYSQSQPIVTTSRGETLQPRTSDGAYLLKYVRTDVEVYIDGILLNPPPVANEPIRAATPEPEIWSENACLCIRLPEGMPTAPVRIFTPEGRLLDSFRSTPGLMRRQLPTGIYIVQVGATVRKVAVKVK